MRRRPEGKLEAVAEAALAAFSDQGYRLAQMSEIARRAGMSAGTLYLYVEGKEALLRAAFLYAAGALDPALALPIRAESLDSVLATIEQAMHRQRPWPRLREARHAPAADTAAEVADIADELFDLLQRERRVIGLLSRCSRDLPALAAVYERELLRPYIDELIAYLDAGAAAGRLRPIANTEATARGIVELVSWMAMHRTRSASPPPISDAEAKQATRDLIVGGVCAAPAR